MKMELVFKNLIIRTGIPEIKIMQLTYDEAN